MPVKREARPWLGLIVGVILGIALAIIVQQAGWWPLDRLLLFGMIGVFGLIGILLGGVGRASVRFIVVVIPLLLVVASIAVGATGLADANQSGFINGGCTVNATTPLDATNVHDTSRNDPFLVDPNGSLTWKATSPGPIKNYLWNIYVEVGGFDVRVAGNDVRDPNDEEDTENGDTIPNVSGYVQDVTDRSGTELRGVFVVSGDIAGEGPMCDGLAFVRLVDDPFASLLSQIAAGVAILMIIILIIIIIRRSYMGEVVEEVVVAGGAVAAASAEGADEAVDDAVDEAMEGYEPGAEDLPGTDDLA